MDVAGFLNYRKHIDYVVSTQGQWVGLCDDEGWPICDVTPIVSMTTAETRGAVASCEVTVAVDSDSVLVDELVGAGVSGGVDRGRLKVAGSKARLLVIQRQGRRMAYTVTHTVASGTAGPTSLTIHGVDLLEGLSAWPCPSVAIGWENAVFKQWDTDASGEKYSTPRALARLEFGTSAWGHTSDGKAKSTIRRVIQDSLDAVNRLMGWVDDPHMVVAWPDDEDTSERVLIRRNDDSVLDTVAAPARNAGVTVSVDLWWPGDPALRVRTMRAIDGEDGQLVSPAEFSEFTPLKPMQVVTVKEAR